MHSAYRDDDAGATAPPTAAAATTTTITLSAGGWWRGLPSSLSRVFARGPGVGRRWQPLGDGGGGEEGEEHDYDGDRGDGRDSPLPDGEERRRGRRGTSVFDAYQAAVFGGAEPSPHLSSASLSGGGGGGGGDDGGDSIVEAALQTFFGGRVGGGGLREGARRGLRGGAAQAEYELAPVGPAVAAAAERGNVQNVDAV